MNLRRAHLPGWLVAAGGISQLVPPPAPVYDKRALTGGTADEFRALLHATTGLSVQSV